MKIDPKTIPWNLRKNPRDKRGLPIPFIVFRDDAGEPHFTINDSHAHMMALSSKLCGLCGKPFKLGKIWFIGGPSAAFHDHGAFIDAPVHEQCGTFAMKVCPFIAAPSYSKRIDAKTVDPSQVSDVAILQDSGVDPSRPPLFVMARTSGYIVHNDGPGQVYVQPKRPWKEIQYWRHGHQIDQTTAKLLIDCLDAKLTTKDLAYWPENL